MSKLLFFSSLGPRAVPVAASFAAHAAFALAAIGYGGLAAHASTAQADSEVAIESAFVELPQPPPTPEPEKTYADHESHGGAHAEHHSHPYPVAADHDAHPHSPLIDHRLEGAAPVAAASQVALAADAPAAPVFTMTYGQSAAVAHGSVEGASSVTASAGAGPALGGVHDHGAGAGATDAPVAEAGVSQRARLLAALSPEYPAEARAKGLEASVLLEIVVGKDGGVETARVLRGEGDGFEDAAVRAVKRARFSPALVEGQPVRVRMKWTVDFRLE